MSDGPLRVDSRAWTGDLDIPPIERAFLSRRSGLREKRRKAWALALAATVAGALLSLMIDLLTWGISGAPPYLTPDVVTGALPLAVALGAGFVILLLLTGGRKWLPLVPLPAIVCAGLVSSVHYLEASKADGPIEKGTFYVRSLYLTYGGRGFRSHRYRASATLVDRYGRRWTLYGQYAYIKQLADRDCLTASFRSARDYYFAVGPLTLVETPYADGITGRRHSERCFASPARS